MKSPQDIAEKWSQNLGRSGASITAGVQAVTVSPMEAAAAKADDYIAGVQEAVSSGKWQRGLRRVTLEQWRAQMLGKGVQRIQQGATAAKAKMADFYAELLPYTERVKQTIKAMPKGTPADADARMLAAVNLMRQFRRTR